MTDFIKEIELPSRGLLYGGKIPPTITIRAMTTKDEKMIVGSGEESIRRLLSSCITEPQGIDVTSLALGDQHFILVHLRILSYGPEYNIKMRCPACSMTNTYVVNLEELEVNYLPEDFREPFEVVLPRSKRRVGLKLMRFGDLVRADERAKKVMRRGGNAGGDPGFIFRMASMIATIDGKAPESPGETQTFVENLIGMDSAYIHDRITKVDMGYDVNLLETCVGCGEETEFVMPLTAEFFRPTFNE